MALNRKYAALPDLDSAPDIYETPELTDDNSTLPPTTVRSPSDNEFEDEDDDAPGISRTRLRIDQARSRFMPSSVDARDVDFSDRVNGKRKSYKTTSSRHRILSDGTEALGDFSDDDEAESLERKLARLKREVEEAKEEYRKQAAEKANVGEAEGEITSISEALEQVMKGTNSADYTTALPRSATKKDAATASGPEQPILGNAATYSVTYAPTFQETHALAKAADFDNRLVLLEKALGIGSTALPGLDADGLPRAVVPTLQTLQKQISTLSEASTASLDTISRRVRALAQEADALEKSRRAAKAAQEALASTGAVPAEAAAAEDSEQTAKINALYGTLPTIENLQPLIPPLLDRLRSLRAIHADAATASETLDGLEKRQAEMAADIKQWKEGLDKIEASMKEGETAMAGNAKVIEGWVKELEQKVAKLS